MIKDKNMHLKCREATQNSMIDSLLHMVGNYMCIYDEYYKTCSRDSAFLKDLMDSILGIAVVLDTYVSNGSIYPDYAIEKLKFTKRIVDNTIEYFENKKQRK